MGQGTSNNRLPLDKIESCLLWFRESVVTFFVRVRRTINLIFCCLKMSGLLIDIVTGDQNFIWFLRALYTNRDSISSTLLLTAIVAWRLNNLLYGNAVRPFLCRSGASHKETLLLFAGKYSLILNFTPYLHGLFV